MLHEEKNMATALYQKAHKKQFLLLFCASFIIRLFFFFAYIIDDERYQQPDSMDYHNCALGLYWGTGMHRADNLTPIFWRTPGYPLYLAAFYKLFPHAKTGFKDWKAAHIAAIVVQIFLCSFIPLFIFLLAQLLTHQRFVATTAAWISVFHPGFVLASMYILTEGLAVIFFLLFLYYFYQQLRTAKFSLTHLFLAALFLGMYAWMRPMGQFVTVVSVGIMLFFGNDQFYIRLKKALLFFLFFALSIFPWYLRNYTLTGQWFFCPMSGPYLNSFCAPKIVRSVKGLSLEQSIRLLYGIASQKAEAAQKALQGTRYVLARETICGSVAWPIIKEYPWLFIKDWMREVTKTTFDLYSYQLAAIAANTFRYDPLEEFLTDKIAACLYGQTMPWWMRIVSYLELIYAIALWIGLFCGAWVFMLKPCLDWLCHKELLPERVYLSKTWWQVMPLVIAVLMMTGGFGYARLRLPVEALMIVLSLTWWFKTTSHD
jgi:hypothetical protein